MGVSAAEAMNVEAPPPASDDFARSNRRWFLTAFYVLAVANGLSSAWSEKTAADYLLGLCMTWVTGIWAIRDAMARGHPIPALSRGWFILFANPAVPVYVIWSRGWRGVGWLLLHLVGFFGLTTLVYFALSWTELPEILATDTE